ncbi:MAG: hypothetical protein COU10_01095 [Candidatus Harrisonbacteria bacterium CG10_big_fil_rev_8_21_14_0_10_45_28]|uniref:Uncharacterized protein n=1 Tax=Candidatus Harrisonbacteria bacterium CG10_big_fil_rev_8_21_14_0_10_45_28 TaxID=1974586 RepID=A0A2H0UNS7_9BACT|nr:MAG: hypothetical protein COU10_01095 [Candidatus Harrisonbacteria bacterium CG10_big_fil_rev_8_21_14_0_10_45_28]
MKDSRLIIALIFFLAGAGSALCAKPVINWLAEAPAEKAARLERETRELNDWVEKNLGFSSFTAYCRSLKPEATDYTYEVAVALTATRIATDDLTAVMMADEEIQARLATWEKYYFQKSGFRLRRTLDDRYVVHWVKTTTADGKGWLTATAEYVAPAVDSRLGVNFGLT